MSSSSIHEGRFLCGKTPPSSLFTLPGSVYSALFINLTAIAQNYAFLSQKAPKAECVPVLKANAYGVGAIPVALRLYKQGCRQFFVAYADEGIQLRQAFQEQGIDADVIILNGFLKGEEDVFVQYRLTPTLTDLDQLSRWRFYCHQMGQRYPVVLHIDTGMSRTGLPEKDYQYLAHTPQMREGLDLKMIISQMVYSYQENPTYSALQQQKFNAALSLFPKIPASLAKTGAIFLGKEYHYQIIRPGIGLYGVNPMPGEDNPLSPAVSLWAKIYQIQDIKSGQSVGYCQTFKAKKDLKIATVTIGYADGYPWAMANQGFVCINGYQAPIVGRISMDLMTVDVTHIPESLIYNGAWVCLVNEEITIDHIAQFSQTVPYEVLLGLGKRFYRVYHEENC